MSHVFENTVQNSKREQVNMFHKILIALKTLDVLTVTSVFGRSNI